MRADYSSIIQQNINSDPLTPSGFLTKHKSKFPKGTTTADISSSFRYLYDRGHIDAVVLRQTDNRTTRAYFSKTQTDCPADPLERLLEAVAQIENELRTLRQIRDLTKLL